MIQRTSSETSVAALPTDLLSHGVDVSLTIIARKEVMFEQDQCINTAFLMQGVCTG
jgi:hypothetical protein